MPWTHPSAPVRLIPVLVALLILAGCESEPVSQKAAAPTQPQVIDPAALREQVAQWDSQWAYPAREKLVAALHEFGQPAATLETTKIRCSTVGVLALGGTFMPPAPDPVLWGHWSTAMENYRAFGDHCNQDDLDGALPYFNKADQAFNEFNARLERYR